MHGGDVGRFYAAALKVLAFVEQRRPTGRRTGADADARWNAFRGSLTATDRIDLQIRDADAEWPSALGPRAVFELGGLAADEPFGAGWQSLDPVDAEEIWRRHRAAAAPASVKDALLAIAAAWELRLELGPQAISSTDRVLVVGPSAIASAILHFSEHSAELDWTRQVTVVATPPGHRQLAVAAAALLNQPRPTQLTAGAPAALAASLRGATVLTSHDAHPDDLARLAAIR
jgi:hypothetical protein